jgi:hypothetical protein
LVCDLGIDFAQDYHIGKPEAIETFLNGVPKKTERTTN